MFEKAASRSLENFVDSIVAVGPTGTALPQLALHGLPFVPPTHRNVGSLANMLKVQVNRCLGGGILLIDGGRSRDSSSRSVRIRDEGQLSLPVVFKRVVAETIPLVELDPITFVVWLIKGIFLNLRYIMHTYLAYAESKLEQYTLKSTANERAGRRSARVQAATLEG